MGIQSILLEGEIKLASSMIAEGWVDYISIVTAPLTSVEWGTKFRSS